MGQVAIVCVVLVVVLAGAGLLKAVLYGLVGLMAILLVAYCCAMAWERHRDAEPVKQPAVEERAPELSIAERADLQHQQFMDGDPEGVYGIYPPFDYGETSPWLL